jgi:hypothetical protein
MLDRRGFPTFPRLSPVQRAEQLIPRIRDSGHALKVRVDFPDDPIQCSVSLTCTGFDAEATYRMERQLVITKEHKITSTTAAVPSGEHHLLAPCGATSRTS